MEGEIKIKNSVCMAIVDTAHCSDLFLPDYGVGITQDQREICREKLYKAAGDMGIGTLTNGITTYGVVIRNDLLLKKARVGMLNKQAVVIRLTM